MIVFQTDNLLHFAQEVIRDGNKPWQSEINDVWDWLSDVIWTENPGVLSFAHCIQSSDPEIKTFAESLDETWQIIDLRNPVLGDGFSWGRYGPKTVVKRFGMTRIFALSEEEPGAAHPGRNPLTATSLFRTTMFRVRQESIPYAADRQQVPGISRVVLNVPSQPDHKIVDGTRVGIFFQPPHFFENLLARYDTAIVPHEMPQ